MQCSSNAIRASRAARTYISQRLASASPGERRELQEWDDVLRTMSIARLSRFLVDAGQRATRLRQTMPFFAVLTPEEKADATFDSVLAERTPRGTRR